MSVIWNYRNESGVLLSSGGGDWGGQIGSDISVTEVSALAGSDYGLSVLCDDTAANYVYPTALETPITTGRCRIRFYVNINSLSMADNDNIGMLWLRYVALNYTIMGVSLVCDLQSPPYYYIWPVAVDDDANQNSLGMTAIGDGVHYIEFDLIRETSGSSNDGSMQVWIDGVSKGTITGVDNYARFAQFNSFRFGPAGGKYATTTGTMYLDEIVINDDGSEIGPLIGPNVAETATSSDNVSVLFDTTVVNVSAQDSASVTDSGSCFNGVLLAEISVQDQAVAEDTGSVLLRGIIFEAHHESGDFSEWGSHESNATIEDYAALGYTSYGMAVNVAEDYGAYSSFITPDVAHVYSARFYIDPNSATFPDTTTITVFTMSFGPASWLDFINIKLIAYSNGDFAVCCEARDFQVGYVYSEEVAITDGPHVLEVHVVVADTGSAGFYVDGVYYVVNSGYGIDNGTDSGFGYFRLYAYTSDYLYGWSEQIYLDEIIINNTGDYIGEMPLPRFPVIEDTATVTDSLRHYLERVTALDIAVVSVQGGIDITVLDSTTASDYTTVDNSVVPVQVTDATSVSDYAYLGGAISVVVTDACASSDTAEAVTGDVLCSASDTATASDFCDIYATLQIDASDNAISADSVICAIEFLPIDVSDTVTALDETNAYYSLSFDVYDTASSVDQCDATVSDVILSTYDEAVANDSAFVVIDYAIDIFDIAQTSDALVLFIAIDISVLDNATSDDSALLYIDISIDATDAVVALDTPEILSTVIYVDVLDSAGTQDYADLGGSQSIVVTESITSTDYTEALVGDLSCLTTDTASVSDIASVYQLLSIDVTDSAVCAVSVICAINILPLDVYDLVTATDTATTYHEIAIDVQDMQYSSDSCELFTEIPVIVQEIAAPSDVCELVLPLCEVSVIDECSASDIVDAYTTLDINVFDTSEISEISEIFLDCELHVIDVTVASDAPIISAIVYPDVDNQDTVTVDDFTDWFTDEATVSDFVVVEFGFPISYVDVQDVVPVSDEAQLVVSDVLATASDTASVSDTVYAIPSVSVDVSDATEVMDVIIVIIVLAIEQTDTATALDNCLCITSECVVSVQDNTQATDTPYLFIPEYVVDVSDAATTTDIPELVLELSVTVQDILSASDIPNMTGDTLLSVVEAESVTDTCFVVLSDILSLALETLVAQDTVAIEVEPTNVDVSDTCDAQDTASASVTIVSEFDVSVQETSGILDAVYIQYHVDVSVLDVLDATLDAVLDVVLDVDVADSCQTSDTSLASLDNFCVSVDDVSTATDLTQCILELAVNVVNVVTADTSAWVSTGDIFLAIVDGITASDISATTLVLCVVSASGASASDAVSFEVVTLWRVTKEFEVAIIRERSFNVER